MSSFYFVVQVIIAKKQKDALEKKMKDMEKDRENLLSKNKMLISERARICQTLDTKVRIIDHDSLTKSFKIYSSAFG